MVIESTVLLELLVSCDGGRGPHSHTHTQKKNLIFATIAFWEVWLCCLIIKKFNSFLTFLLVRQTIINPSDFSLPFYKISTTFLPWTTRNQNPFSPLSPSRWWMESTVLTFKTQSILSLVLDAFLSSLVIIIVIKFSNLLSARLEINPQIE